MAAVPLPLHKMSSRTQKFAWLEFEIADGEIEAPSFFCHVKDPKVMVRASQTPLNQDVTMKNLIGKEYLCVSVQVFVDCLKVKNNGTI